MSKTPQTETQTETEQMIVLMADINANEKAATSYTGLTDEATDSL